LNSAAQNPRWFTSPREAALAFTESWAILGSLVNMAKLHELDPQAYLVYVLEGIVSGRIKSHQLHELLAWNWKASNERAAPAAA